MNRGLGLVLVGGTLATGLLVFVGSAHAKVSPTPPDRGWVRRAIAFVSGAEGKPDSLNRNLDGAGLSFGILQWNQRAGSLGVLLTAMQYADPDAFARIFGSSWPALLAATSRGGLEPVDGSELWQEPWASRFVAAGRYAPFVEVQWRVAETGEHFQGALEAAQILGIRTERAMELFFDRSVQQGPDVARRIARTVPLAGSASERLRHFAALAAEPFRRTTAPESPYFSPRAKHIVWVSVGTEWHATAGKWDLYADTVRRTQRVLNARELSDVPV